MCRHVRLCVPPTLCRAVADTDDEPGPTGPTPEPWPVARHRPERRTRPSQRRRSAPNRLPVPPEAADDPGAVELIRAWVAGRGLYLSLYVGPETAPWNPLLAAAVRRVADALGGGDAAETRGGGRGA